MEIKNQSLVKTLQKGGLTDKEALVYVALLELGGAYPSRVATYAGLKRPTTYDVLVSLSIKGLVNEIEKKNKIFYQPDKPYKLQRFGDSQIQKAKDNQSLIEKVIPDIEGMFSSFANRPKVLFFEGPDAVFNICQDMVSVTGNYEMIAFSNAAAFKDSLSPEQIKDFVRSKEKLNITTRGILPDDSANRGYSPSVFRGINKKYWPNMRFVSADKFPFEAELTVYGKNKVSITKLKNHNVIGVIIEDQVIHDMMKMVFELAWESTEIRG